MMDSKSATVADFRNEPQIRNVAGFAAPVATEWQPTSENILDVARYAARIVLGSWYYTPEDREDGAQVAALDIWIASQRETDKDRGFYFVVGRRAILRWLHNQHPQVPQCYLGGADIPSSSYKDYRRDVTIEELRARAPLSDRELTYIRYRMLGYSTVGIAREMGYHEGSVRLLRSRLIPKLQAMAQDGIVVQHKNVPLSQADCEQIEQWRMSEIPWIEIATRLKISPNAIRRSYRRACERYMREAII